MKSEYKITPPVGKSVYIIAKTRAQAIEEYHRWTGIPKEYIKKHCAIKNLGGTTATCEIAENIESCEDCVFCA